MFMNKENCPVCKMSPGPKQIKIPVDGQLSKKGTVVRKTKAAGEVDYSIAGIIESLNEAGYKSTYSCSGLKKDHPFKDVKPDGGYISFLIHENGMKALSFIKKAAVRLNLTVEERQHSSEPALVVRIDKDHAGNSLLDRIRIANECGSERHGSDYKRSFGAFTKDLEAIIKNSGGLIYNTDDQIEAVWLKFRDLLLDSSYESAC